MITHEFVLSPKVPHGICFTDFKKEDMVVISDDFILENFMHIKKVRMYCQKIGQEICGLDYHGITIITSDMANNLAKELSNCCKKSKDLSKLIAILEKAITNQSYVIHFGV